MHYEVELRYSIANCPGIDLKDPDLETILPDPAVNTRIQKFGVYELRAIDNLLEVYFLRAIDIRERVIMVKMGKSFSDDQLTFSPDEIKDGIVTIGESTSRCAIKRLNRGYFIRNLTDKLAQKQDIESSSPQYEQWVKNFGIKPEDDAVVREVLAERTLIIEKVFGLQPTQV